MINLVVWSKNRAAQLHLLLESIQTFCKNQFLISVIFTGSDSKYLEGYERVKSEFSNDDCFFISESNLWNDTYSIISNNTEKLICFSTDDTVIYKQVPKNLDNIITPEVVTFSLRYGLNTTLQNYYTNQYQPPLNNFLDEGETILWRFSDYHPNMNYGYPFGLDMHVYRQSFIHQLVKYQDFKTTNEFESYLFNCKHLSPPMIRSFKESVAVNIPTNNMSGVTLSGRDFSNTTEYLNSEYLQGKTLDLEKVSKEKIIGSHQEISLQWKICFSK